MRKCIAHNSKISKFLIQNLICAVREVGKWGSGEVGKWGSGEVGKWGTGEIELKPQNPKTPKPQHLKPADRRPPPDYCMIKLVPIG